MAVQLTLYIFLAVFTCTTAEFTGSAAKLLVTEMSGTFSNEPNLEKLNDYGYKTNQDMIDVEIRPINNIPELNAEYFLYFEELVEGKLTRQQIFALKGDGDFLEIRPYDFAHPESFVPGNFNISSLELLRLNDLNFREECKVYVERTGETTLVADWPDCTSSTIPKYTIAFRCDSYATLVYSHEFPEAKSKMPYNFIKYKSFQVPASILPDYEVYKALCNY